MSYEGVLYKQCPNGHCWEDYCCGQEIEDTKCPECDCSHMYAVLLDITNDTSRKIKTTQIYQGGKKILEFFKGVIIDDDEGYYEDDADKILCYVTSYPSLNNKKG